MFQLKLFGAIALVVMISWLMPVSAADAPAFSMGNGDDNWIVTDGFTREGDALTFPEVQIDGNGWLVIHPFKDGAPDGDQYLGATYLPGGSNKEVAIRIHRGITTGEPLLVMLHRDVNDNRSFDFIFLEDGNVVDRAVFEGHHMIGHVVTAP